MIDNKNNQIKLDETVPGGNLARMELMAILKSLGRLHLLLNDKMKSYADITVFTNSIYCTNVLKEWIYLWEPSKFEGRPNSDLLIEIFPLLSLFEHLNISCNPISSNECPKMQSQNVGYYYLNGTHSRRAPNNDCIHLD